MQALMSLNGFTLSGIQMTRSVYLNTGISIQVEYKDIKFIYHVESFTVSYAVICLKPKIFNDISRLLANWQIFLQPHPGEFFQHHIEYSFATNKSCP